MKNTTQATVAASTKAAKPIQHKESTQGAAGYFTLDPKAIANLSSDSPAPRRPNRCQPLVNTPDFYDQSEVDQLEMVRKMTPSNEELLEKAKHHPPPPEWYVGDEEELF